MSWGREDAEKLASRRGKKSALTNLHNNYEKKGRVEAHNTTVASHHKKTN